MTLSQELMQSLSTPHLISSKWLAVHLSSLVAHAAVIQIIASVIQAACALATLFVMGGLMWMQMRTQREQVELSEKGYFVTKQTHQTAQIQKDIAYSQYETGMTELRWRVWRNYDDQVSAVLGQIRTVLEGRSQDRDKALSIYGQLHACGYQLVWTFGQDRVGEQVSTIDKYLGLLLSSITDNSTVQHKNLSAMISMRGVSEDKNVSHEQIDLWNENAPFITRALDEIVENIASFMRIKEPVLLNRPAKAESEPDAEAQAEGAENESAETQAEAVEVAAGAADAHAEAEDRAVESSEHH